MRNGIELWAESERLSNLINALQSIKESKFIEYDGQLINTADITGIFNADVMSDFTRKKNGQWKCSYGTWHDKGEKCDCKHGITAQEKIRMLYG